VSINDPYMFVCGYDINLAAFERRRRILTDYDDRQRAAPLEYRAEVAWSLRIEVLGEDFENVIVLSAEFYQEVSGHPIPTDLEAVKVLAAAPAVLDLFMWLTYRCFTARGKERVSIFGDFGLANQLGSAEYARPRRFRERLDQWLDLVLALWPTCPARITSDGNYILIESASAIAQEQQ